MERLGEDMGRLDGVVATLVATYGSAARPLGPDEVEPFLGEGGGVPPWDLTDAIDAGRTPEALGLLGRMMGAGGRHPLQVMAILHGHYTSWPGSTARTPAPRPRPQRSWASSRAIRPARRSSSTSGWVEAACNGPSSCWPPPISTYAVPANCPTTSSWRSSSPVCRACVARSGRARSRIRESPRLMR